MKNSVKLENPQLHALYVEWALEHLCAFEKVSDYLESFANCNTNEVATAVHRAVAKLILENAAYDDAFKIFHTMKKQGMKFKPIRRFSSESVT